MSEGSIAIVDDRETDLAEAKRAVTSYLRGCGGSMDVDLFSSGETILDKGIMPSEKVLDFPVDCNTLTGSVNL